MGRSSEATAETEAGASGTLVWFEWLERVFKLFDWSFKYLHGRDHPEQRLQERGDDMFAALAEGACDLAVAAWLAMGTAGLAAVVVARPGA